MRILLDYTLHELQTANRLEQPTGGLGGHVMEVK